MCHLTLQNIFEHTKVIIKGLFLQCAQKYSSRCSGEQIFAPSIPKRLFFDGENRFPPRGTIMLCNITRAEAISMFFAGSERSA
jgi:hypothetical protein